MPGNATDMGADCVSEADLYATYGAALDALIDQVIRWIHGGCK